MKKNVGGTERVIRFIVGLVFAFLAYYYFAALGIVLAGILGVVGLILIITGLTGSCAVYSTLGKDTTKK